MIIRTWSARATAAGASDYCDYFAHTLLPELRKLAGFAGATLLSRDVDGEVELTAHTRWETEDAIHAFAGDDITISIVETQARAFLLHFDPTASRRTVLIETR